MWTAGNVQPHERGRDVLHWIGNGGYQLMNIVTLHSHDLRLLPYQVAAFRRFASVEKFTAIVGPFGMNATTSAGSVRLAEGAADRLGIEVLNAPESFAGLPFNLRLRELLTWAEAQTTGERFIGHGDLLPLAPMTLATLTEGKPTAGRVHSTGEPALTWFALAEGKTLPEFDVPIDPQEFRDWGAERRGDLGFEYCAPGFLHADKLTTATWGNGFAERFNLKLSAVADELRAVGVKDVEPLEVEQLTGLPNHAPRLGTATKPSAFAMRPQAAADDKGCGCSKNKGSNGNRTRE